MNMIRHYYVTTYRYIKFGSPLRIFTKCMMRLFQVPNLVTMQRPDGDKEKRGIICLEDLIKPGRSSLDHKVSVEAAVPAATLLCGRARPPLHPPFLSLLYI